MLNTLALFRQTYPSGKRTLYVSPAGSDSNNGLTVGLPKLTIQGAVDSSAAGDRIIVAAGTYAHSQFYGKNGDPGAWITLEGSPGAKIDLSAGMNGQDGLDIQNSTYIAVYGLEVIGIQSTTDTGTSGISIYGYAVHVAVWGCNVHDWPAGGINCFYVAASTYNGTSIPAGGWDHVDLFFNTIHGTSKYSPYNGSGISFYAAQDYTGTTTDGTYAYRAVGNYIYDVICTVPYTPGGFNFVTDGNGISPDSLSVPNSLNPGIPGYFKRGLIEGNTIVGCGGRGVLAYNSQNIDIVNNTLVGNLRTNSPAINGSSEIATNYDTATPTNGVVIANNVVLPLNTTKTLDLLAQTVSANTVLGGTDTITGSNINARASGAAWFITQPTVASILTGGSIAGFCPATPPARQTKVGSPLGFQSSAIGGRGTSFTPGALEPYTVSVAFIHS